MLHLGTLVMTAVFASTVFLDAKQTTAIAVVVMFVMFLIGDFSAIMNPTVGESLQHFSTWFYYKAAQVFRAGNFANLAGDALVLTGNKRCIGSRKFGGFQEKGYSCLVGCVRTKTVTCIFVSWIKS